MKTNLVFFTRGPKTERIWYYDLSQVKVGKKTPLTLRHFDRFFELLDRRGTAEAETEHSWTIDFAARRRQAADEAAPHRRNADAQRERAAALREQTKALRRAGQTEAADSLAAQIDTAERGAREALGKAQAIEDAVYDLKAVNPREKKATDTRTPAQLLAALPRRARRSMPHWHGCAHCCSPRRALVTLASALNIPSV